MTETGKTTVQCTEETKAKLDAARQNLRWTMPQVVELAAEALETMLADEETPEQRKKRVLEKFNSGGTGVRSKSHSNVTQMAAGQ